MYIPRTGIEIVRESAMDGAYIETRDIPGDEKVVIIVADSEEHWHGISAVCEIVVFPSRSFQRLAISVFFKYPFAASVFAFGISAAVGAGSLRCYQIYRPFREFKFIVSGQFRINS